ncbi:MAG: hypothetical protein CTY35_00505 [Methylotenera sp.]|uniref:hypothetical protein n=1 Tax=Methylotenera sp. TaxID=2051956 RepID=UPI000D3FA363|nr:hypothetical protein [Methylotenera sp.]PPC84836.1 MAG: hypothetical protein CTY38_00500 [Methylotenera sp.]PPD02196.1 MAG: hypothetical protein CTY35_00505 [Methylotenera sp.]
MALDINQIISEIDAASADELGIEDIENFSINEIDDAVIDRRGNDNFYSFARDMDDFSAYSFDDR